MLTAISRHKFKFDKWWIYKIGSGVFTWLLIKFLLNPYTYNASANFNDVALLTLLIGLAIQGHLYNDWGDVEVDTLSGKANMLSRLDKYYSFWVVAGITILNLSLAYSFFSLSVFAFTIVQTILNILYSLPPTRIKERGILSIIITGLQERALPYTLIIIYISNINISVWLMSFFLAWAFLWECRNYVTGQISDEVNDHKTGVKSIVSIYGSTTCTQWIRRISYFELTFFIGWLVLYFYANSSAVYFAPVLIVLFTTYFLLNPISTFSSVLQSLDYTYNHALLSAACITLMLLNPFQNFWLAIWLFIFPNKVLWAIITTMLLYAKTLLVRLYYFIRKPVSLFVNYSLYYFRLHILRWPESKSRGEKN